MSDVRETADHEFKAHPSVFYPAKRGDKTFEFRKDDRGGFHVGQTVRLRCYHPEEGYLDEPPLDRVITDILYPGQFGLQQGYCILSLKGAALSAPVVAGGGSGVAPVVPEGLRNLRTYSTDHDRRRVSLMVVGGDSDSECLARVVTDAHLLHETIERSLLAPETGRGEYSASPSGSDHSSETKPFGLGASRECSSRRACRYCGATTQETCTTDAEHASCPFLRDIEADEAWSRRYTSEEIQCALEDVAGWLETEGGREKHARTIRVGARRMREEASIRRHVQALGAAISRREWSEVEAAHAAIRDAAKA
ncbi:hypothetical protein J2X36_002107 [Methylobacterium sp. BE186]|uniref:DUF3850 domain-containing protein n=1 Tax=Methylobacterium sp. BE186 TaxID=2817715 RepID=UPI002858BC6E|nr:DUF3850 domain-containing protein [Methylobacterium sp. BE186]MDR7037360.1 hypothetical protein [Methylobacterium sp. BE186]